jgi:sugar phosphate isomerase/epimerase
MRRLALTSWSLNKALSSGALALTDLPAQAREAGIATLEICHFHLPSTEPAYLAELRAAIEAAGVELFSILIDTGDISSADAERREADIALIASWMEHAAALGAGGVRVVAGESQPDDEAAFGRAVEALGRLAQRGRELGLRVRTENFRALASSAAGCNRLLDSLDGAVGLCADVGNFPADVRVREFEAVAGRAEVVHAKAGYSADGAVVADDLRRCLELSVKAGFSGPYTLVYDQGPDEWGGVAKVKGVVQPFVEG